MKQEDLASSGAVRGRLTRRRYLRRGTFDRMSSAERGEPRRVSGAWPGGKRIERGRRAPISLLRFLRRKRERASRPIEE